MSFLTDIKQRLFYRKLAAETTSPSTTSGPVNLTSAKSVIILFPADDAGARKQVEQWKEKNRCAKQQVRLVGYFSGDTGSTTFDFLTISAKEKNWYGVPKGEMTTRYLGEDCDLLLRLGPAGDQTLDYLAATKKAALKVGPHHPAPENVSAEDNKLSTPIYQLQFDGRANLELRDQLAAIEAIFSFTNAKQP